MSSSKLSVKLPVVPRKDSRQWAIGVQKDRFLVGTKLFVNGTLTQCRDPRHNGVGSVLFVHTGQRLDFFRIQDLMDQRRKVSMVRTVDGTVKEQVQHGHTPAADHTECVVGRGGGVQEESQFVIPALDAADVGQSLIVPPQSRIDKALKEKGGKGGPEGKNSLEFIGLDLVAQDPTPQRIIRAGIGRTVHVHERRKEGAVHTVQ